MYLLYDRGICKSISNKMEHLNAEWKEVNGYS